MPELAEVEYFRKQWNPGLGARIIDLKIRAQSHNFRDCNEVELVAGIQSAQLLSSQAHGKQMLFTLSGDRYLGIHLGMTGKLFVRPKPYVPGPWDPLVLEQKDQVLVFSDPRQFGKILYFQGKGGPPWWNALPPALTSPDFTEAMLRAFLKRRKRSTIKGILLMQERFPGIGNWMADEILWRTDIHPAQLGGELGDDQIKVLFKTLQKVCQQALKVIGRDWSKPPDGWLFNHRWKAGGICPKTKVPLVRETIAGRTTCWSPGRQVLR